MARSREQYVVLEWSPGGVLLEAYVEDSWLGAWEVADEVRRSGGLPQAIKVGEIWEGPVCVPNGSQIADRAGPMG